jgi:hypothetical protein
MSAPAHELRFVDGKGIGFDEREAAAKVAAQFLERRNAAAVALDRGHGCTALEQRARQAAGAGTDLIDPRALERSRKRGDPREQLPIEDEVLAERLARAEPVAGDDRAERFGGFGQGESARKAAFPAAIRIAAAIGRGSARS